VQLAVQAHRVVRRRGSHIFLVSQLTDGGDDVTLTRRPPFTPQEDSWYLFPLEATSTPGPECDWIRYIEKFNDLIGNRTRDYPACSIVAPKKLNINLKYMEPY
jgi:hypothetical protein